MDKDRGIGKNNAIPWHLSSDLRRFKKLTMGHHIIMGRKTYESISRKLPGREMIIVTNSLEYKAESCIVVNSIEDAFQYAAQKGENELFIIGGGEIFEQSIKLADRIYLTAIDIVADCDVLFPKINVEEWNIIHSEFIDNNQIDQFPYTFQILDRKRKIRKT